MRYFVLDDSGESYGPADQALLQQWVDQGRISPQTHLRAEIGGDLVSASTLGLRFPGPPPTPMAPPPPGYGAYVRPGDARGPQVDYTMYLVWAVISAVFCCQPFGIAAAVYAGLAMSASRSYETEKAAKMATTARTLTYVAAGFGLVGGCVYFGLMLIGALAN